MDTIKVEVDFYDAAEEAKLLEYPTANDMRALVTKTQEIPKSEFLTYYLFHRIKLGTAGYRDYKSVAKKVDLWLSAIGECINYEGGSVRTPEGTVQQLTEVSEHVGEAIGLSVMNLIHGLTEADWAPIPEERGRNARPSFDFQIASDGKRFVQVETKGSSVLNNRIRSVAALAQKRRIDEKKAKLAKLAELGKDLNPTALRYGTITLVDGREDGNVRCLLTDPPAEKIDEDPAKLRLLNRMRSLRDWIGFLSPRSAFAAALATRVADLAALTNPFELDRVPLVRGNGESFESNPQSAGEWHQSFFMASKSRVIDQPAGGVVFQLSPDKLFFLGVREELIDLAARQNFTEITRYKSGATSMECLVKCTFSPKRYANLHLPDSLEGLRRNSIGYVSFPLKGILHYSCGGLVFGVLPLYY